jgi:hypothetical protein
LPSYSFGTPRNQGYRFCLLLWKHAGNPLKVLNAQKTLI